MHKSLYVQQTAKKSARADLLNPNNFAQDTLCKVTQTLNF